MIRINRFGKITFVVIILLLAGIPMAWGDTLIDFESPPYSLTVLPGQDSWVEKGNYYSPGDAISDHMVFPVACPPHCDANDTLRDESYLLEGDQSAWVNGSTVARPFDGTEPMGDWTKISFLTRPEYTSADLRFQILPDLSITELDPNDANACLSVGFVGDGVPGDVNQYICVFQDDGAGNMEPNNTGMQWSTLRVYYFEILLNFTNQQFTLYVEDAGSANTRYVPNDSIKELVNLGTYDANLPAPATLLASGGLAFSAYKGLNDGTFDGMLCFDDINITSLLPSDCNEVWANGFGRPSDLNRDCDVDFEDFSYFGLDWMRCNDPNDPNNCEETWF